MSYIYGANNTPAFEYGENKLNDGIKESYKNIVENGDSKLAIAMKEYIEILKRDNYKLTEEAGEKRNEIFDKFQKELGLSFFNQ